MVMENGIPSYKEKATLQERQNIEHSNILRATRIERQWWRDKRFSDETMREKAIEHGHLVSVPFPNKYFGLPAYLRGEENERLRYLNPEGKALLMSLLEELDDRTHFSSNNLRLIITSLHRTDVSQNTLKETGSWYRAAQPGYSSHAAGAAFDINVRTMYVYDPETNEYHGTWYEEYAHYYNPRVIQELIEILDLWRKEGRCNYVIENEVTDEGEEPAVIHVCAAPDR